MVEFNPNDIGIENGNYFGLPYKSDDCEIIILPVPWDVTTSYNPGTHKGPQAILDASLQVDLFDVNVPNAWEVKIGTIKGDKSILNQNRKMRVVSEYVIDSLSKGQSEEDLAKDIAKVNKASIKLNQKIEEETAKYLEQGKLVAILGGEHSVPFGAIKALSQKYEEFGILHIDAHCDLREAYEGFTYSHASIMYNVLKEIPQVTTICQVGQRDFCDDEYNIVKSDSRVAFFSDMDVASTKFEGGTWCAICDQIIASLPENVYISFDIDGLSSDLCPNTGTPVPGGISFREADYLLHKLATSGKKIIGFDLCEVSPGESEWDANVGARVLYKLCLYAHLAKK